MTKKDKECQDLKFSDVPAGCFASLEAIPTAGDIALDVSLNRVHPQWRRRVFSVGFLGFPDLFQTRRHQVGSR